MLLKEKHIKATHPGENREYFKLLFTLAIPIIFQNLFASSVNLIDTVMVGQLGDIAVASVGLGNQIFFIYNLLCFGIVSATSIFIAQFWGKKDMQGIHKTIGAAISIIIPISVIYSVAAILFPQWMLSFFTPDKAVIEMGSAYLPITAVSYTVTAITFLYATAHRNTGNVRLPLMSTVIALSINVILNYFLIFGIWIFPEMGVRGAALATSIARIIEMSFILIVTYVKKTPIASKISELFSFTKIFIKKYLITSIPVFLTESLWGFGTTLYFAIYGRISTDVIAAVNISKTVENFFLIFFWGSAAATAAILGKAIGEHNEDKAFRFAKKSIVLGLVTGVVLGTALLLVKSWLISLFNVSQSVVDIANMYLILTAAFMIFRGTSPIMTVGILRAGGDTFRAFLYEVLPLWLICLPLAYLVGLVFKLPLVYVFGVVVLYEVLRFVPSLIRTLRGKWINNLVDN